MAGPVSRADLPAWTTAEVRELIALLEELLARTTSESDRMDLHHQIGDLLSRVLSVEQRHLAHAAGLARPWGMPDGRDCLLTPRMTRPALRHLAHLAALPGLGRDLIDRAAATARILTRP